MKIRYSNLPLFSHISIIVYFIVLIISTSCHSNETFYSPDQTLKASTQEDSNGILIVNIFDKEDNRLFEYNTRASTFHKWSIDWQGNNKIMIQTSDIGPTSIIRNESGDWYTDDPLRQISPNGKMVAYVYWRNYNQRTIVVALMEANGNEQEASIIIDKFETDVVVSQLEDCIEWSSNRRFSVKADNGIVTWSQNKDGDWEYEGV